MLFNVILLLDLSDLNMGFIQWFFVNRCVLYDRMEAVNSTRHTVFIRALVFVTTGVQYGE